MKSKTIIILVAFGIVLGISGCAKYYQITDPTSGSVYYTKDLDHKKGGGVQFKDERSGTQVTVQNSEVAKISKDAYRQAVYQKAEQPGRPAPETESAATGAKTGQ